MPIQTSSLLALLHRANQMAEEQFATVVENEAITVRQVQVLLAIEANEGASQARIVEATGVDRSTLAEVMRRLQRNRLVERRRSRTDARAYVLKLTDAGRVTAQAGRAAIESVEATLLGGLSPRQRTDLLAALAKMVEGR